MPYMTWLKKEYRRNYRVLVQYETGTFLFQIGTTSPSGMSSQLANSPVRGSHLSDPFGNDREGMCTDKSVGETGMGAKARSHVRHPMDPVIIPPTTRTEVNSTDIIGFNNFYTRRINDSRRKCMEEGSHCPWFT